MATALSNAKSRLRSRSIEGHTRNGDNNSGSGTVVRSGDGPSLPQSVRFNGYGSSPGRVNGEARKPQGNELNKVQKEFAEALSSHGSALWNHVSTTASKLSINVSQAWHKSIRAEDGEETPQGEDSRLTKAMKAYHLSRARTPAELPAWLFTERERGVGNASWKTSSETSYEDRFRPDAERSYRPTTGGLREVYDSIKTNNAGSTPPSSTSSSSTGNSQAIERLRAIRQANRAVGPPQQSNANTRVVVPSGNKGLPSGPKEPRLIRG